jgi:ABC-type multidrug transport system permease subunit
MHTFFDLADERLLASLGGKDHVVVSIGTILEQLLLRHVLLLLLVLLSISFFGNTTP